ncbi:hypothetical protein Emed_006526 [Eimeria media]
MQLSQTTKLNKVAGGPLEASGGPPVGPPFFVSSPERKEFRVWKLAMRTLLGFVLLLLVSDVLGISWFSPRDDSLQADVEERSPTGNLAAAVAAAAVAAAAVAVVAAAVGVVAAATPLAAAFGAAAAAGSCAASAAAAAAAVVVAAETVPLLSVEELEAIANSSNREAAVLLYASWDSSSPLLLQTWRQAALSFRDKQGASLFEAILPSSLLSKKRQKPKQLVLTATFDCAQQQQQQQQQQEQQQEQQEQQEQQLDAKALCRSLGVPSLPALLYFTPRPLRHSEQQQQQQEQQAVGFFDDEEDASLHFRATRFKGDLLMKEAILDWLLLLRYISRLQLLTTKTSSKKQQQQQHQEQREQQHELEKQQQIIQEQRQLLQQQQMELQWLRTRLQKPS